MLGSGLADRVFARGDADRKLGRAIWVISCWFIAPIIAIVATGCVARIIYEFSAVGLVACFALNFGVRRIFRRRADVHEQKYHTTVRRQVQDKAAVPELHSNAHPELTQSERGVPGVAAPEVADPAASDPQAQPELPEASDGDTDAPESRENNS